MRKDCEIITFHTPINYGAVLQATALFSYVSSVYQNTVVIDFDTKTLRSKYPLIRKCKTISDCFLTAIDLFYLIPNLIKRLQFKKFLKQNIVFTKKYKTFESIKKEMFDTNFLITGSDQVFRPNREYKERNVFYLDLSTNAKKISYAASLGGVDSIDGELEKEICGYLSSFSSISIREKSGVNTLSRLGFSSTLVLDPVFLLNREQWENILKNNKKPKRKNYILYYALIDNPIYHKYVECLAKKLKKRVLVIGNIKFKPFKKCEFLRTCGPTDFLTLVNGADYVFTSSFHGIAFSIIFKKQFYSLEEDIVLKNRAEELMKILGIPYYGFSDFLSFFKTGITEYIDYDLVYSNLKKEISKSKSFLNEALGVEGHE